MTQFIFGLRRCLEELLSISLIQGDHVAQCKWSKGKERLLEKSQCLIFSTTMRGMGSWMSQGRFLASQTRNAIFVKGMKLKHGRNPWTGHTHRADCSHTHKQMRITRIRMISSGFLSSTGIPLTSFSSSPT